MSDTTRRGKSDRDSHVDIRLGVGASRLSRPVSERSHAYNKSMFNGKLLSVSRRIAKLSHSVNKFSNMSGKALFDSAHDYHETAIKVGLSLLRKLSMLAYPDKDNSRMPRLEASFVEECAAFSKAEHQAQKALVRAMEHYTRNNNHQGDNTNEHA